MFADTDGDNYGFSRTNIALSYAVRHTESIALFSNVTVRLLPLLAQCCFGLSTLYHCYDFKVPTCTYICIYFVIGRIICIMDRGRRIVFHVTRRTIRVDAWRARESREISLLIHCGRTARAGKWHSSTSLRKRSLIGTARLSRLNAPVEMKCILPAPFRRERRRSRPEINPCLSVEDCNMCN